MKETARPELTEEQRTTLHIVTGQTHPELAQHTADYLSVEVWPTEYKEFKNGELYIRFKDSVRGMNVYVMQSHVKTEELSIDGAIRQQRLMIDAALRGSAARITAVAPYLGYSRQDRKAKGREPISATMVVNDFQRDGAERIVSFDLHSGQTQGFFHGPYDHLTTMPVLCKAMQEVIDGENSDNFVVVSPDAGRTKVAEMFGEALGLDIGYVNKRRSKEYRSEIKVTQKVLGEVAGRTCFLVDDILDTGGTLAAAAEILDKQRATDVMVFAAHGLFSNPASQRLADSPVSQIYVTDTLPQAENQAKIRQLKVLSIAPILGRAIAEIQTEGSVSKIFGDSNYS